MKEIYSVNDLSGLPDNVKKHPVALQRQWVHVWNSAYKSAIASGASKEDAESKAFAEANGVLKKTESAGSRRLLMETNEKPQKLEVLEAASPSHPYTKFKALVSEGDRKNLNGRVYPMSIWEKNIPIMKANLDERPGAAYHPSGDTEIPDIAILWTDIYTEDKKVYAEGIIIDTRVGSDLDKVVRAGVKVGISSRGYGSVKEGLWQGERADIIQDDYECETFDAVVRPSSQDARILAYESENKMRTITTDELMAALNSLGESEYNNLLDDIFEDKWTTAHKNDLPDSAFALVHDPVNDKSKDRALPYKNAAGEVDAAHVRNALARLPLVKGFSDEEKAAAKKKLQNALKSIGGEPEEDEEEGEEMKKNPTVEADGSVDESKAIITALRALLLQNNRGEITRVEPTESKKDPDNDNDDDTTAAGDTDHDYVEPDGSPGPKAKKKDADEAATDTGGHIVRVIQRGVDNVADGEMSNIIPINGLDGADSDPNGGELHGPETESAEAKPAVEATNSDKEPDDDDDNMGADNGKVKDSDDDDDKDATGKKNSKPTDEAADTKKVPDRKHLDNAITALGKAVNREVENGNFFNAGNLSHMAHHAQLMNDPGYYETFNKVKTAMEAADAKLKAFESANNDLNEVNTRLSEDLEAAKETIKSVEESRVNSQNRLELINTIVEKCRSEKFSWTMFSYLLENVNSTEQLEAEITKGRKIVEHALMELGHAPGGKVITEHTDVHTTPNAEEVERNKAVDWVYRQMDSRR